MVEEYFTYVKARHLDQHYSMMMKVRHLDQHDSTKKGQRFKCNCSTQSSPAPSTSIDAVIAMTNKNLNLYTNESWGCEHRIEQVVVHYMTLKVGDRQQMVYQATGHGRFWMMDDEDRRLSILSLQFWWVDNAIICYVYRFSYFICLYTSSTPFQRHLCSKVNQLVVDANTFRTLFPSCYLFSNRVRFVKL